jgi:hypothetical protein
MPSAMYRDSNSAPSVAARGRPERDPHPATLFHMTGNTQHPPPLFWRKQRLFHRCYHAVPPLLLNNSKSGLKLLIIG